MDTQLHHKKVMGGEGFVAANVNGFKKRLTKLLWTFYCISLPHDRNRIHSPHQLMLYYYVNTINAVLCCLIYVFMHAEKLLERR